MTRYVAFLRGVNVGGINIKKREANVTLSVVNARTTEEEALTEGYARKTDVGFGGGAAHTTRSVLGVAVPMASATADVAAARAAVRTAQIDLDYTKVASPIAGRVGRSAVTPGALVTANQATALATVQQLDPMWDELFPAEQARIVALLVERVEIVTDGLNVRLRMDGLAGLAREITADIGAAA